MITRDDLNIKRSKKAILTTFGGLILGKKLKHNTDVLFRVNDITISAETEKNGDLIVYAVDDTNTVIIQLFLIKKNAMYYVDSAVSNSKTYKVHQLYKDLLVKNIVQGLITKEQSIGGRAIWDKLSKFRNVEVFGWDPHYNEPINLGNALPDEIETHVSVFDNRKDKDTSQTRRMLLVAVKKIY